MGGKKQKILLTSTFYTFSPMFSKVCFLRVLKTRGLQDKVSNRKTPVSEKKKTEKD